MYNDFIELWHDTHSKLCTIWTEIGHSQIDQDIKAKRAYASIKAKLKEIQEEEETKKKQLIRAVEELGAEVCRLSKCLQEDPNKISSPDEEVSLLELQTYLNEKVYSLKIEATRRKKMFLQLKNEELELCNDLCEDPSEDEDNEIPTLKDIHFKKQIVDTLTNQKILREKKFVNLRSSIMSTMEELQRGPATSFEKNIFSEREHTLSLSAQNLEEMKKMLHKLGLELDKKRKQKEILTEEINLLSERLELSSQEKKSFWLSMTGNLMDDLVLMIEEKGRLKEIRQMNMGRFVMQLREELKRWWDTCYISEDDRDAFDAMNDDDYTEELLQQHEDELARVKALYEKDSHIYKMVAKWFELWSKVNELKERANDPKRLFGNRGCSLLQEERERKRVNVLLPKTVRELEQAIQLVEEERQETFLVCGMPFTDFIQAQLRNYDNNKCKEKQERHAAKTKQLQLDAKIGTGKVSVKRPNSTRNTTQASKYIKTGDNQRTPVRQSSRQMSRCTSMSSVQSQCRPPSRLFTLRESNRKVKEPSSENTFNSMEVSSYVKFSERLQTMSERENIRSSVLIPHRLRRQSPRLTPRGLPRTPIRTGGGTPSTSSTNRNARTVPANLGQRRTTRQSASRTPMVQARYQKSSSSPSLRITPLKNKLSFLI